MGQAPGGQPTLGQTQPELEEVEDAALDGDIAYRPGSARAALAQRPFRLVFAGAFASNIGSWMQNVALGAFGYQLTHSATFVAILGFAQLGPILVLSVLSGVLADSVNRKVLLITAQAEQLLASLALAWVSRGPHPSLTAMVGCVLAIGVGNAVNNPVFSAVLPILVGRRDLAGAVSLQSVQMNLSRVIGPAVGGLLLPLAGASLVFAVNAGTYLFAIAALATVAIPRPYPPVGERGLRRLMAGFTLARSDRRVSRSLLSMFTMSLACLPFITLMPVVADQRFHLSPTSTAYGILYASFGLGAALGAASLGTVLVDQPRPRVARLAMGAFALALAAFAVVPTTGASYPIAFFLGLSYFATVTARSTFLQELLEDVVRGRVMALWIMAFGGTIPLGGLLGGALVGRVGVTPVLLGGAVVAATLAAAVPLVPGASRSDGLARLRLPLGVRSGRA